MYQEFFSLKDLPFSISPDPDFVFLSERHQEALAHLKYGLQSSGGFVVLSGEVGTGKTTICRLLLQDLPEQLDIAFIHNPTLNDAEMLAAICDQFDIAYQQERPSLKQVFDNLVTWITDNQQQGRKALILIDEAQHLSFSVLEQLRLLTNIESGNKKALQIILIGQNELRDKLKQTELRQLTQRITARYHLSALTKKETEYYIRHRLNVAGAAYPIFEPRVEKAIFKYSRGVPRLINLICDRCLLCAYSENTMKVSPRMLKSVVKEMELDYFTESNHSLVKQWGRLAVFALLIFLFGMQLPKLSESPFFSVIVEKALAVTAPWVAISDNKVPDIPVESALLPERKNPAQTIALPASVPPAVAINEEQGDDIATMIADNDALVEEAVQEEALAEQKQQLNWFDDYPLLDLSQGEFAYALRSLYAIWGYQVDLLNIGCQQGAVVSLFCFSQSSDISRLKQLNYPAVIKLLNGDAYLYVVVYKKAGDHYQLLIGEQSINVSENWLAHYWQGGLTLLWKAPFSSTSKIHLGEEGERVAWLNNRLNEIYARPASNKVRFDLELEEQIKAFQRAHSLIDDGIVGERTLMLIMQKTQLKLPRLIDEDK